MYDRHRSTGQVNQVSDENTSAEGVSLQPLRHCCMTRVSGLRGRELAFCRRSGETRDKPWAYVLLYQLFAIITASTTPKQHEHAQAHLVLRELRNQVVEVHGVSLRHGLTCVTHWKLLPTGDASSSSSNCIQSVVPFLLVFDRRRKSVPSQSPSNRKRRANFAEDLQHRMPLLCTSGMPFQRLSHRVNQHQSCQTHPRGTR